jgi:hypothetical protein|tara:strand:+ start:49 stop:429 length:381 start_codon:yes stop_codon:yes gene_type:complete
MTKESKTFILVNLWGLGDLLATLYLIKIKQNYKYHIITPQDKTVVKNLITSFAIESSVTVTNNSSRYKLAIEIIQNIFSKNFIIFTSPLSGRSRIFASLLSLFSKNIVLSKESGNIYENNKNLNIS